MYNGHVFWDQETWMYPPIQLLHGKIGKAIIKNKNKDTWQRQTSGDDERVQWSHVSLGKRIQW